jgi:hypothetical protein
MRTVSLLIVLLGGIGRPGALYKPLDTAGKVAPREQHTPSTGTAHESYVGTHAYDFPSVAATGMYLAHFDYIANVQLGRNLNHLMPANRSVSSFPFGGG